MTGKRLSTEEKERIENRIAEGATPHRIAGELERSDHTIAKHVDQPDVQMRIADKLDVVAERAIDSISDEDYRKASLVQKITGAAIAIDKRQLLRGQPTSINVTALLDLVTVARALRDGQQPPPLAVKTVEGAFAGKSTAGDM